MPEGAEEFALQGGERMGARSQFRPFIEASVSHATLTTLMRYVRSSESSYFLSIEGEDHQGRWMVFGGLLLLLASVFDLNDESIGKYVYINQGGTSNLTLSVANLVVILVVVGFVVVAIAAAIPRRVVS